MGPWSGWERKVVTSTQTGKPGGGAWEEAVLRSFVSGFSDGSPPVSSVDGILQVRILEWVAISSCRGSSRPRDRTRISCIGRRILYLRASRKTHRSRKQNDFEFGQVRFRSKCTDLQVLGPVLQGPSWSTAVCLNSGLLHI